MRIYKERYTNKDGKRCKTAKWYIDFTDHRGKRHRIPGFAEKRLTQKLADNIETLVSCAIAGQTIDKNMQVWIEALPEKLLKKLISIGLIDGHRAESGKLLTEHLEDYREMLTAKGKSETHINGTVNRIKAISEDRGFKSIRDVRAAEVVKYIGKLRQSGKTPTTRNHYLTAFKMFMNWLKDERRITDNPIAHLKKEKAQPEKRGALTSEQFNLLVHHVSFDGKVRCKTPGKERGMLYLMAGMTGLRRGELLTLTWSDLQLGKTYATVNLDGNRTKNGEDISQPLPKYAAKKFSLWKAEKDCKEEDKVFPHFTCHCRPSEWIKADLKAAGLPIKDYMGNDIDFHSLRNSYISFLADSNTPPKLIQKLARHSSLDLTMNIYARPTLSSERAAIDNLPVPEDDKEQSKKDDQSDQQQKRRSA